MLNWWRPKSLARSRKEAFEMSNLIERVYRIVSAMLKKKLAAFDFDDTIVSSSGSITVTHEDGEKTILDSAAFAYFKGIDGDKIDFSDYNNVTKPRIIKKGMEALKKAAADEETRTVILTARPKGSESAVKKFMDKMGLQSVEVVALQSSDPMDKARWIEQAAGEGVEEVTFMDDNKRNAEAVGTLEGKIKAKVVTKNPAHPKESDYDGKEMGEVFQSDAPVKVVIEKKPAEDQAKLHETSNWWKSQTDDFKREYCEKHPDSAYCGAKTAAQRLYYHVAPTSKVSQIRRDGIKAPAYLWDNTEMAVWFKHLHEDKDESDDTKPMTILMVDAGSLNLTPDNETMDMEYWSSRFKGRHGGGWIVKSGITPDHIMPGKMASHIAMKIASIQDVIDRIENRVRDADLARELVNKVKRYSISHNPADDLSPQEIRMIYGQDDCGDDFDLSNGNELDIGWSNHARYRSELRDVDPSAVNDEIREFVESNLLRRFRQKVNLIKHGLGKVVVDIDTTMNPERAGVVTVIASETNWQQYLGFTPESLPGMQYYTLEIPVGVEPPVEGDRLVLNGKNVVVFTVSTPEDIAAGRGGPVANSMKNGVAYRVNCLPEGHEWLRPVIASSNDVKSKILERAGKIKSVKAKKYVHDGLMKKIDQMGEAAGIWLEKLESGFENLKPKGMMEGFEDADSDDLWFVLTGEKRRKGADALLFPGGGDGDDPTDSTHHYKLGGDMKCKVMFPPEPFDFKQPAEPPVAFLGGAIDMGKAEDWQTKLTEAVSGVSCVLLNPRRKDWDSSWEQSIDNPEFKQQVEWELKGLEQANVIVIVLPAESKAPISLLEFGLHAGEGKVMVFCPDGYYRKGNVDVVAARYGVPVYGDWDEFVEAFKSRMSAPFVGRVKAASAADRIEKRMMAKEFFMSVHAAKDNHKVFKTKKEALAFLSEHALMSVGWKEGNKDKAACYWNGKVHITDDDPVSKTAADENDVMAGEKMSRLYTNFHTHATKLGTSRPPASPVAVQILDSMNKVTEALKGKMGLTGRAAVKAFLQAVKPHFNEGFTPIASLIRRYGRDAIQDIMWERTAGLGDMHTFGSPLRRRRDYGERDGDADLSGHDSNATELMPLQDVMTSSDNMRVRVITDRIVSSAKEFM